MDTEDKSRLPPGKIANFLAVSNAGLEFTWVR